jgi:Asp-tRNA(Asn)/Glu-tRNA(Gln) amidotransferase A subunit family amidase
VKVYSQTLDTISWFARDLADLGLLCDVFDLHDDEPVSVPEAKALRIGLCRSPAWAAAEAGTPEALEAAAEALRRAGADVSVLDLPPEFEPLGAMQAMIMHAEGRAAFLSLSRTHPHLLHDDFFSRVENRDGTTRAQLVAAYDHAALCRTQFGAIASGYDAVLTPSAKGEAPLGRHPGDAVFNRMWTLLHVPCVNIPGHVGPNGMPVGVTLTAPRYHDRRLLAVAGVVQASMRAD